MGHAIAMTTQPPIITTKTNQQRPVSSGEVLTLILAEEQKQTAILKTIKFYLTIIGVIVLIAFACLVVSVLIGLAGYSKAGRASQAIMDAQRSGSQAELEKAMNELLP